MLISLIIATTLYELNRNQAIARLYKRYVFLTSVSIKKTASSSLKKNKHDSLIFKYKLEAGIEQIDELDLKNIKYM